MISVHTHDKRRCDRNNQTLQKNQTNIKAGAIPKIFPELTKYLSAIIPKPGSGFSSSTAGRLQSKMATNQLNEPFLKEDRMNNFNGLLNKIDCLTDPEGYVFVSKLNYCSFHLLEQHDDISISPKLLASAIITEELKVNAFTSSIPLKEDIFIDFLTNGKVVNLIDLSNILAICKNLAC